MTLATLEDTRERAALAPYAEAVHDAIGASMAPNTRRAYRTQWAAFTTWADGRGVQSLPAAPETLDRLSRGPRRSGRSQARNPQGHGRSRRRGAQGRQTGQPRRL